MLLEAVIRLRDQFTPTIKKTDQATKEMTKGMKAAGVQAQKMKMELKKAYEAAKPKDFLESSKKVGTAMTAGGMVIGAGLGFAVKKTMDFESAMSEVAAISGATGDDLVAMSKAARAAGAATSKTATESANALKYMSLAGWNSATSMSALMPVLRLSEAGNLDLARTSDLVTDSMAALGITVEELPKFLDQVAQSQSKANTSAEQLMEAMLEAGGSFRNLNVPLDEANALMGILANRGKKGAEAGNSMSSIMINLTSGAGQAGTAMKELNLSAFDASGQFKGMTNVLFELKEKTANMTEEQRTMYLSMIGGKTQISTLQALLAGVGEEYGQLRDDILNSDGALEAMAKTMKDNLSGSLTELSSAAEEMAISVGEVLTPYIRSAALFAKSLADRFNSMSPAMKKAIAIAGAVAAGFLLIAGPVLILISMLPMIAAGFTMITSPVVGAVAVVVGVVMGMVAAVKHLWSTNENFRNTMSSIWSSIKTIITTALDLVLAAFEWVWPKITKVVEVAWAILSPIFGFVASGLEKVAGAAQWVSQKLGRGPAEISMEISSDIVPGHAAGLRLVPYDDYLARLHKGEMVLTRLEADRYRGKDSGMAKGLEYVVKDTQWVVNKRDGGMGPAEMPMRTSNEAAYGHAAGLKWVPYDKYPALLHKGETVLTRAEADQYRSGTAGDITIAKLADTIVIREEQDIDKIINALMRKLRQSSANRGKVATA